MGWTQRQAAAELGVTQAAVWGWEQGRRRLPESMLAKLNILAQQVAAEQQAAAAADPLEQARQEIAQLQRALEDARLGEQALLRAVERWQQRARAAEQKIALMEAEKAAAAEQARKVWEAFKQAGKPAAPTHPYSAADLRDLAELGLDERATWEAIKQAGKAAAARHHPDAGGNNEDFTRTRAALDRLKARHAPKQQGAA
jgi:transcriptional regulator with XRE-family HTH domain